MQATHPFPRTAAPDVPAPVPAVALRGVSKVYGRDEQAVLAVDRLSLNVRHGEFLCLVGASGCG